VIEAHRIEDASHADLPDPLVCPDVDLRDFSWMPIEIHRLRRSKAWLICKRKPELAFYMINLWTACWHDTPAASLEDDDDVLADLAMCEPSKWAKVREQVMRGWIKCLDGRLYHPIVAELAANAWQQKQAQRQRTEAARLAREQKRQQAMQQIAKNAPTDTATKSVTDIATESNRTEQNREGPERDRRGTGDSMYSEPIGSGAVAPPPATRTAAELTKAELWTAGKSLLEAQGMPAKQCGTFVGKLVKDFGDEVVVDAVRTAVVERPADAASFLKATCQQRAGIRQRRQGMTEADREAANARANAEAAELLFGHGAQETIDA
jgi:hypothetical protein